MALQHSIWQWLHGENNVLDHWSFYQKFIIPGTYLIRTHQMKDEEHCRDSHDVFNLREEFNFDNIHGLFVPRIDRNNTFRCQPVNLWNWRYPDSGWRVPTTFCYSIAFIWLQKVPWCHWKSAPRGLLLPFRSQQSFLPSRSRNKLDICRWIQLLSKQSGEK